MGVGESYKLLLVGYGNMGVHESCKLLQVW